MKPTCEQYDVVVIGAGPAGSAAAKRLGHAGLKVAMVEQRQVIGNKVQCAEFVPLTIAHYATVRECDIAQRVQGIKTFINGKTANVLRAPGYVLNRRLWDEYQADRAKAAGVAVMSASRATGIENSVVTVASGAQYRDIRAKFILGCDGPNSLVSSKLGNLQQESCVALQYEMLLTKPVEHAEIHFEPAYYGGYAWAFPKGKTANVGVAIHAAAKVRLKKLLEDFCQELIRRRVLQDKAVIATTGGLIPTGGLVNCPGKKNMLVVGDAAGCTHPITGAGIMNAVVSGHFAAKAVIMQENNKEAELAAENYTQALTAEYGKQFAVASERLSSRNQNWTNDAKQFAVLIRRSWIAFPEYYAQ